MAMSHVLACSIIDIQATAPVDLYLFLCAHVTRWNMSYNRRKTRRRKKRDEEICKKGEGKGGRGAEGVAQS